MKNESNNKLPLLLEELRTVLISFDETEKQIVDPESGETMTMYEYESVRTDKSLTYSKVVSAIITDHYPEDRMQAVINNYLKDPTDEQRKAEFDEMQSWRDKAKEVARLIFPNETPNEE